MSSDNVHETLLVVLMMKRIYAHLRFVSECLPVLCVSFDSGLRPLFVMRLGCRYVLFLCPHMIQIADHCVACMHAVRSGLQCFRSQSYSYNPTLPMPIPHKCGLDSHFTPEAIEQTNGCVNIIARECVDNLPLGECISASKLSIIVCTKPL